MKCIAFIIIIAILWIILKAQAQNNAGITSSHNTSKCFAIGGAKNDNGSSIIQTIDGGFIIVGTTDSFGAGMSDVYVVKLDNSGAINWTLTIGGKDYDYGNSIIQTSDGGYAIAGSTKSFGAGSYDVYVIKLNKKGRVEWTRTIGGANTDYGHSIIQTSDGGYVIVGYTDSYGAGMSDVYVVKLDNMGSISWSRTIGGTNNDYGHSIIQTSDGEYALTGSTYSFGDGDADVYVAKLDNIGYLTWNRTIGGSNTDFGNSIIQTSDGGYVIVGNTDSFGAGMSDVFVVKLDNSGTINWSYTIGGKDYDYGHSIIQTSDGNYAIAGATESFGKGKSEIYVVLLDSSGTLSLTRTIGGAGDDFSNSIIQTSDGGFAIAGSTVFFNVGNFNFNVYVIKLDSTGNTCCSTGSGGTVGTINPSVGSGGTLGTSNPLVGRGGRVGRGGGKITNLCL